MPCNSDATGPVATCPTGALMVRGCHETALDSRAEYARQPLLLP